MRHAFGKFGLLLTPKSGHTVYKIPLILAYKKRKKREKEESLIDLSLLKKEPIRRVGMGLGSGS